MIEHHYRLDISEEVSNEFLALVVMAREMNILSAFFDAAIWIQSELKRTPLEFGEARYSNLLEDRLMLRCATIRPIHVEYVVHEKSRNVFIRSYRLVKLENDRE